MNVRMKKPALALAVLLLAVLGFFGWRLAVRTRGTDAALETAVVSAKDATRPANTARPAGAQAVPKATADETPSAANEGTEQPAEVETPEPETAEDREEKLVNAFDDLTDAWQEPAAEKVTMDEIARFRDRFNRVPKARKDECLHRALNLIPDENVMLLAGILLDKSQAQETLETVYGDILNRDEEVKRPILQEIFKDRTHPCWADTAWILDVTDDLPKTNTAKGE